MEAAERINAEVWSSRKVLGAFAAREGYIDAAEEVLLPRLAEAAARRPILDIGVGAGRTIPLLAPASDGYVAVDYLPEMVELARSLHPGTRVEQADARDLSGFEDESFGAVFFSFNGIDGIAHEDRAAVHRAAMRVLEPGGSYLFSTHNLDYCAAGLPPWHRLNLDLDNGPRAMLACAARMPQRARSYRRLQPLTTRGAGWAVLVGAGYDYGVLWHHVSPAEAAVELERAGFASGAEVFDVRGRPLAAGSADSADSAWLYLLARKPATAAPG
jgi:SAM-dependent methyltransferase